jgi:acyl CoA:acetate/3-ketoacid CoA transferase alpha subunit
MGFIRTAAKRSAGGAGIPAFFTATGFGTPIGDGKETREFNGRLEPAHIHTPGIYIDRLIHGHFQKEIESRTVRKG